MKGGEEDNVSPTGLPQVSARANTFEATNTPSFGSVLLASVYLTSFLCCHLLFVPFNLIGMTRAVRKKKKEQNDVGVNLFLPESQNDPSSKAFVSLTGLISALRAADFLS